MRIEPNTKSAILYHGGFLGPYGKTGNALLRYADFDFVAVIDSERAGQSIEALSGIACKAPIVATVEEALALGAEALFIGIAPPGGILPEPWRADIVSALKGGMSLVNGLHGSMAEDPEFAAALQPNRFIWDCRLPEKISTNGSGAARTLDCFRVLTVGADMAAGKMTTSLLVHRALVGEGISSRFLATGQTGIMICGEGFPLDAYRVDFASGAVETYVRRMADCQVLNIEGQGSLFNPASTATLPLLRGAQPQAMIYCTRAFQTHCRRYDHVPIPPLPEAIRICEEVASAGGSFEPGKVLGIAINTFGLDEQEARRAIDEAESSTGLCATDPVRFGVRGIVEAIKAQL